jgi:NAD(P)-dependent dehydrogenase (short-subunit alcohol dehydrogenase family)
MFEDLKDKKILIVGASQGIGKNLVTTLAQLGAHLYIASRNIEKLNLIASELGSNVHPLCLDILNEIDYLKALDQLLPLDGVCVVAGSVKLIPPKLLNRKLIDEQLTINLGAPLALIGSLLKKGLIKDSASIIFTSSVVRHSQASSSSPYAAAKMGLLGATKSLAADLSKRKIRVNCVSFDYVNTEMTVNINTSNFIDGIIGVSPVEFTATPYCFLLSDKSRWITGQVIAADAGRMLTKTRYV